MSHETGGPGEGPTDTDTEEEFMDVDETLEEEEQYEESEGFFSRVKNRLGNAKDRYVDIHTVNEEEPQSWGDKQVAGGLSRRGFLSGAAQVGAGAFAVTEATDNDGFAVDLSSGDRAPAGGGAPAAGENQTNGEQGQPAGAAIDNPEQYAWKTEEELINQTGICYPQEPGVYIGAIDADQVGEALDESGYNGEDPTGALSVEEVEMDLEDITAHQGLYAVDVDRKQGNSGDYNMFVQLVGEEDGGLYLTREGAMEIDEIPYEETFEGYQECN